MFKSLIATCLLTFSCSGAPRQEVQENSPRVTAPMLASTGFDRLYGAYCLREVVDQNYIDSLDLVDLTYTFSDLSGYINIYTYVSSSDYQKDFVSEYLSFAFEVGDEYNQPSVYVDWQYHADVSDSREFDFRRFNSDAFSDVPEIAKRFQINFCEPFYPNNNDFLTWFNIYFTSTGNTYNSVYTGWYTFNSTLDINTSYDYVYGTFMVDNNLYNQIIIDQNTGVGNSTIVAQYTPFGSGNYFSVPIYEDNAFKVSSRAMYITGTMFTDTDMQIFTRYGVFQYVIEPVQYTFGEMIFNIMDAPIYLLTSLFSFELFGIQFYVAFFSIATIVLICFVLKKII